jgi:hypothetical protein
VLGRRWYEFSRGDHKILFLSVIWILLGVAIFILSLTYDPEILVEWETETEFETVGFNLWRKKGDLGDFRRINEVIIPGSSDPVSGDVYSYVDLDVESGITYYYQLEDIARDGTSTRHKELTIKLPQSNALFILLALSSIAFGLILGVITVSRNNRPSSDTTNPNDHRKIS